MGAAREDDQGYLLTAEVPERAVLVGVALPSSAWRLDDTLAELARLVETDGAVVVGQVTQRLEAPNPRTFIGSGKVEEIAELLKTLNADIVVFDDELSPSQQSNLERAFGKPIKVIDRTALILDIFALHATTREGRLQVRLAQNQYLLPRLRGMWAHLAAHRMGGGVGSRFGEGESQLEVDRRLVRKRITSIQRELKSLATVRATQRKTRQASGVFKVALAGYTNAGKSSLLNALCGASVLAYDQLFATLDSTTRRLTLPEGREVVLSDTVGFIQKLPTTLIEAFNSTLDEVREADLILHVVDATAEALERHEAVVQETLAAIDATAVPVIEVFNKIDELTPAELAILRRRHPGAAYVSAVTGEGLEELLKLVCAQAASHDRKLDVVIPYDQGAITSLIHRHCRIISETFEADGTHLCVMAPATIAASLERFAVGD